MYNIKYDDGDVKKEPARDVILVSGNGIFQVFQVNFELRDENHTVLYDTTTGRYWKRPQITSSNEAAVVVLRLIHIEI